MATRTILWRRLDTPGHDACRLEQTDGGARPSSGTRASRRASPISSCATPGGARATVPCKAGWASA